MATETYLVTAYPWQYSAKRWGADSFETFRVVSEVRTIYSTSDGQIVETDEITSGYGSPVANPINGFLYGDGVYRAEAVETFRPLVERRVSMTAIGEGSYEIALVETDIMSGRTTTLVSIVDGTMPLAPNVASAISGTFGKPVVSQMVDLALSAAFAFTRPTTPDNFPYAQNLDELRAAQLRSIQRAAAIKRQIKMPARPDYKIGQTLETIDENRNSDAAEIIVGRQISHDGQTGEAGMVLDVENWPR
jgi:hypothetical protein